MNDTKTRGAPPVPTDVRDEWLGAEGLLELNGLLVAVRVLDVKNRYGHIDVLVTPRDGLNRAWVQSTRIQREKA